MAEYVIGVDIGSSKSHLALFSAEGRLIDFGRWGPLNYEVLPGLYSQFEDEFGRFTSGILLANGLRAEQIAYAVFGAAGVDTKKQHDEISRIIGKQGFRRFTLCNDAFLGIPAGNPAGVGICAICGSGGTIAGINHAGEMLQIGGLGDLTADMGGGGYIGKRAVAAVYSQLFRKGEATAMTPMLFSRLGIGGKHEFVEKLHEKMNDGSFDVPMCNPMVFEAAGQGDGVAAGILQAVAGSYASGIEVMIEELGFAPEEALCIVLAGSVFIKGEDPLLIDTLEAKLHAAHPGRAIRFKLLETPNVAGAVVWALNALGCEAGHHAEVCARLREACQNKDA